MQVKLIMLLITFQAISISHGKGDPIDISDLNPSLVNADFRSYNPPTAIYCAQLSEMVYLSKRKIEGIYNEILSKYPDHKMEYTYLEDKKTHVQALLWCNSTFIVISFRGTEPSRIKDWITDLKFWTYENNADHNGLLANMPAGHGGFRKSLMNLINEQDLFEQINATIKRSNPDADLTTFPIYLTGHSLGAAISQLFMECLRYKKYQFSGAYHFAPPLAVSCNFNSYMKTTFGEKVYDIVNYKDFIPRAGRNGVAHFGKFYRICDDGLIYKESDAYVRFSKKEYFSVIKYHKLKNHLSALKFGENSTEKVLARSIKNHSCMGEGIQSENPCK